MTFEIDPHAVDPNQVERRILPSGASIPIIGLGTFGSDAADAEQVAEAVKGAASAATTPSW